MDTLNQQKLVQQAAMAKGPYADASVMPEDHSRLRIRVLGECDPQLPTRILGLLTVRGNLPLQFVFTRRDGGETVELSFELLTHEVPLSEQLLDRLLKLPTVIEASLLAAA